MHRDKGRDVQRYRILILPRDRRAGCGNRGEASRVREQLRGRRAWVGGRCTQLKGALLSEGTPYRSATRCAVFIVVVLVSEQRFVRTNQMRQRLTQTRDVHLATSSRTLCPRRYKVSFLLQELFANPGVLIHICSSTLTLCRRRS